MCRVRLVVLLAWGRSWLAATACFYQPSVGFRRRMCGAGAPRAGRELALAVEKLPRGPGKCQGGERLLQEGIIRGQDTVAEHGLVVVAADE